MAGKWRVASFTGSRRGGWSVGIGLHPSLMVHLIVLIVRHATIVIHQLSSSVRYEVQRLTVRTNVLHLADSFSGGGHLRSIFIFSFNEEHCGVIALC